MIAQSTQKKPKTRFIGVDVFKGWGVWYMFIIHAFIQQIAGYNGTLFLTTIQRVGSWWPYIFALPIGIVSLWGFMFGLAFACTVAIQTMKLVDTNPKKLPKYIFHKLITGILIILLNKIGNSLYNIPIFQDGSTLFPTLRVNYNANILDAIAWMGVLVPILVWLLYGAFKIQQTNHLVLTLLVFLTVWFALTPTMLNLGDFLMVWLEENNLKILSLPIAKFTVGRFRLVPGLGYGFLGSIFATFLYKQSSIKEIRNFTLIFFAYCVVGALIWHFFVDPDWLSRFTDEAVPVPLTIIAMSTMQFLLLLFIRTQDYPKNEIKRVRAARRTTFWRRFSLFSLTAFSIGTPIADRIFSVFVYFWGPSTQQIVEQQLINGTLQDVTLTVFSWNLGQIIVFILFIWGFWEIILRLWENFNYKFSLDWFLVQFMAILTGRKMGRANIKPIIYGPNKYQVIEVIPTAPMIPVVN